MRSRVDYWIKKFKNSYDDDLIDRFNYVYSTTILVFLIIFAASKLYFQEALQCFVGAEYKASWKKYIEFYCFVENTYRSNGSDQLPMMQEREQYELIYYQWVPLLLFFQVVLFLAPKTFWSAVSWKSGLRINTLIGQLIPHQHHACHQRKSLIQETAQQICEITKFNCLQRNRLLFVFSARSYFTSMYLIYKLLNLLNTGIQLYFLEQIVNTQYSFWGVGVLSDFFNGHDWRTSGNFPRVTYCDFMRRDDTTSRPMNFTVQCLLMNNIFNEKIFILLWFWLSAVTILNAFNLLYWLIITTFDSCKTYFIKAQLKDAQVAFDDADIRDFIEHWITIDGLTALRLIAANSNDRTSSAIIAELYHDFCTSADGDGKNGLSASAAAKEEAKKLR